MKLIKQDVAIASVKFVLHVLCVLRMTQQGVGRVFDIGEIEQPALNFQLLIVLEQAVAGNKCAAISAHGALLDRGLMGRPHFIADDCKAFDGAVTTFNAKLLQRVADLLILREYQRMH